MQLLILVQLIIYTSIYSFLFLLPDLKRIQISVNIVISTTKLVKNQYQEMCISVPPHYLLVILGNAKESLSHTRLGDILQCVDKSLERYDREPAPSSHNTLFADHFCPKLNKKVISDTTLVQVVLILKQYLP